MICEKCCPFSLIKKNTLNISMLVIVDHKLCTRSEIENCNNIYKQGG